MAVPSATGFAVVRDRTEALAAPLSAEDQVVQSMPDASPTKWHRAHTTWFWETFLLVPHAPDYRVVDERYAFLFNSYYVALGPRHARSHRGLLTRPSVDEVAEYRRRVDAAVLDLLDGPVGDDPTVLELVELGLNHEEQHQELLLMDAKHLLGTNPLLPAYDATLAVAPPGEPGPSRWVDHPGGIVEIGHDPARGFAYDNEGPRHQVLLRPFELADRTVTCGEWLEFMHDGGYATAAVWLSDGFGTATEQGWEAPAHWHRDGCDWVVHTLGGARPVRPDEPVVHVSYYEADAYARWAGARLPLEAEWEVVAAPLTAETVPGGFLDTGVLHPRPAGRALGGPPRQLMGEVWEWTASPYSPYPGFEPAAGAVGEYNGKFMVNQQVLRGGCCATPVDHIRATYRNFYPPGARWAFSGLRLARDAA